MNNQPGVDIRNEIKAMRAIADSIVHVSECMKELKNTRLKEETIITLISDGSGIGKKTVKKVLDSMNELERIYLKPFKQGEQK